MCTDDDTKKSNIILENVSEEEPAEKKMKISDAVEENCISASDSSSTGNGYEDKISEQLSKRQLKKLRKKEKWLAYKPIKRAKEKEKLKQKKLNARINNVKLGPSRKELKHSKMSESDCKVRVAIDMSFDDLMNKKEIGKCIKQLLRCYSLNRRANNPMQFHITSFGGKSEEEMEKHSGYRNWDVNLHSESYMDVFESRDIVYLTSESDNVISCLEDDKVYIIGGLVDHNSHKVNIGRGHSVSFHQTILIWLGIEAAYVTQGLCHQIAEEKGIDHGQLPIGEFVDMKSRKVLTIDHVFQILLEVSGGRSWKDAFLEVLPPRKGAVEKSDILPS